jgi:hypothetical protein
LGWLFPKGTARPSLIAHCPVHADAMVHRNINGRSDMKTQILDSEEVTDAELDSATGGM